MRLFIFAKISVLAFLSALFLGASSCGDGGGARGNAAPPDDNRGNPSPPALSKTFEGGRAFAHLAAQMNFGYRIPGTEAHRKCGDYLVNTLKANGWEVEEQTFTATVRGKNLPMRNIIGRLGWVSGKRDNVILAAHWDTRPWSDQDIFENRNKPVPGANDGASGVAALLELLRIFAEKRPLVGVEIVFFDGEDYGPELSAMFIGSKYFAERLSQSRVNSYRWGVLLDMIGDADLQIKPEKFSNEAAGEIYTRVLALAEALGTKRYFYSTGERGIYDDHLPLIEKGVRMYNLIDFDYPYWHTIEDTIDKCSPESLEIVGQVVENLVYQETIQMTPGE